MAAPSAPVVSPVQTPYGGDGNPPYPMPVAQQPYPMPPQQPAYPMPNDPSYAIPPAGQPYAMPGYPPPITAPPPYGAQPGYPMPPPTQDAGPGPMSNWMPVPQGIPNCPPGLEYLTQIDQLLVHQKVEMLEAFLGFETSNKYTIKNSLGQKVYYAKEDTDCCTRNCCGPSRPFDMKILDNAGNEVIHLNRPLRCSSCWFPCCLQRLEVMAPPGQVVGYVTQEWSVFCPKFRIENAAGDCVLCIDGPFCTWSICGDVEFQVMSRDRTVQVGKITKQWSGLLREAFTDADHFGITFPMDLDVKIKAVLLGACFLIDFMFFEKAGNKEDDGPGML